MRRADRLFQIVQLIRGRRLSTADYLATRLEVSPRTVYRDVAALQMQGVPIEGEAGVGYRMRAGFDLPPLMFTKEEAQALVAAVRLSQPSMDLGLAAQSDSALGKILAVLPPAARTERIVRPLACFFWGPSWTLAAWCELREEFRSFRVDRIAALELLEERFRDEPGKTLADMNRRYAER